MKQPKVSVVVPIYNVEPYLVMCLESLLNQTLTIALNRYHCSAAIGTVMTLQTVPHSVL